MHFHIGKSPPEPVPGEIPLHRLDSPEAHELRELLLIEADLDYALNAVELVRQIGGEDLPPDKRVMRRSLMSDAIIQFCACFGKTEPFKLDLEEVFANAKGDWRTFFLEVLAKRDAYAAHRFGADRQCEIVVAIDPETGTPSNVGHIKSEWAGYVDQDLVQLGAAIVTARAHVRNRIAPLMAELERQVQEMTAEDLKTLPRCFLSAPANARTSRSKERLV